MNKFNETELNLNKWYLKNSLKQRGMIFYSLTYYDILTKA